MSLKFIPDNKTLRKELDALLKNANKIRCAVAFWGEGANAIVGKNKGDIQILCNLQSGGTNPYEIRKIRNRLHSKIKQSSRLHAKVYWTDKGVIIGSSNASSNGIDFSQGDIGNDEANILVTDAKIIDTVYHWFEKRWKGAGKITKDDLDEALRLWKTRLNRGVLNKNEGHILTRLKNGKIKDGDAIFSFYEPGPEISAGDIGKFIKKHKIILPHGFVWYQASDAKNPAKKHQQIIKDLKSLQKYPVNICLAFDTKKHKFLTNVNIDIEKNTKYVFKLQCNNQKYVINFTQPIKSTELIDGKTLDSKFIKLLNESIAENAIEWKKVYKQIDNKGYCSISLIKNLIKKQLSNLK